MSMARKFDLVEASSIFASAHHRRARQLYATEQVQAARALCSAVLDVASSSGFEIRPQPGSSREWLVLGGKQQGRARLAITADGDIHVTTRQHESPSPLKLRYDVVTKSFVGTNDDDPSRNPATVLAQAIVDALDDGWARDSQVSGMPAVT